MGAGVLAGDPYVCTMGDEDLYEPCAEDPDYDIDLDELVGMA